MLCNEDGEMGEDIRKFRESHVQVRPLSDALGAEIIGVDVSQPLSRETVRAVRETWLNHHVIVLRDQNLEVQDQLRFASYLGEIGKRTSEVDGRKSDDGLPQGTMYVSNIRENGRPIGYLPDGEMQFHIDMCYIERPVAGAVLYAIEVPPEGGDTMFSNLVKVFASLPEEIKQRLVGASATHYYDQPVTTRDTNTLNGESRHFSHPVVRTHPETGLKSLFVNRLMTSRIEGLEPKESDRLLEMLFNRIEQPEFVYRHVWRPGDLLAWDNRCTAHARTDFDPKARRLLRRVVLQGDKPSQSPQESEQIKQEGIRS